MIHNDAKEYETDILEASGGWMSLTFGDTAVTALAAVAVPRSWRN